MLENPLEIIDSDNGKTIIFPEYFDISAVATSRDSLQGVLEGKPADIVLKTERIEMIDTAALQLLLVFINAAKKKAFNIDIQQGNDAICKIANILGLTEKLTLECSQ